MMTMTLSLQTLAVAPIVAGCLGHAVWALMPSAARRRTAAALLAALPRWPEGLARRLGRAARAPSGSGCSGCVRNPQRPAAAARRRAPPGVPSAAEAVADGNGRPDRHRGPRAVPHRRRTADAGRTRGGPCLPARPA